MKKEDFKDIFNPVFMESAEKIMERVDCCVGVACLSCPFDSYNHKNGFSCKDRIKIGRYKGKYEMAKAFKSMVEGEKRKIEEGKMQEFKVGDRVKIAIDNQFHGMKGVITELMDTEARLQMDNEYNAKLELTMPFEYLEKIEDEPQVEPFKLKDGMKIKTNIFGLFIFDCYKQGIGQKLILTKQGAELRLYEVDWEETRKLNGVFLSDKERKALGIHYDSAKEMFDKDSLITSEQIDRCNEVDSGKPFYVVYKEPSAKRHLSYEEALEEAKSKLLRSPNDKVCIMKCEAVVESKIEIKVNELK